jgi:anti-sigma28 factor (negative regulator of flagellin synthesis)
MRIDDLNRTPAALGPEKPDQTAQQHAPEKEMTAASDQVDVSHLAQSLAAPDSSRLEMLQMQVESGNYNVSAQVVADALINAHLKE